MEQLRITIEIDGREIAATTLQPPSSRVDRPTVSTSSMAYVGTTAPPEVLRPCGSDLGRRMRRAVL